ncbi:Metal transporter cnnm2 [Paragonimus heterotremus]|uniref:Metal transporter cnnm2 n=1 Tax=Paragonimus heterotremus TaxID=100268 RepID=A0A8J4SZD9_9TREM|nr:Metal transporter cnnm2 [Paragonimus heterotremus]
MLLIFAELLPQSLCTNYGLLIGAKTIILTQLLLFFTAPVSYPVSLLLDKIFGEEIGQVYNREKLKALILAQVRLSSSSHIAVITEASKCDQENGPKARSIGVVTLEDIIEEILQEEIIDETDMITDNVRRQRRKQSNVHTDLYLTINKKSNSRLPPQLKLAALRHITTTVKSFHSRYIHISVLQSFFNGAILKEFDHEPEKETNTLYTAGRSADYAILVLQGNLLVEVSEEHLQFEAGAFMFFGETIFTAINRLIPELPESWNLSELLSKVCQEVEFVPDYTVTLQSTLQCLEIKAEHYLMARYLSDCVRREPNPDAVAWLSQSNYFKEAWESRHSTNIGQAFKEKARSLQPTVKPARED